MIPGKHWNIFNAPCRERSIKMKGQTASSSFVSVLMNFLHFYAFFFLFYGGGRAKYSEGTGGSHLKTKLSCCHSLWCWASPKHWRFGRNLDLLWHGRNPEKCWVSRFQMRSEQVGDPPGHVASRAHGVQSLFLLPPPFPLEMFLLHMGEWWHLWFHSEIIHFQRRKVLGSNQEWIKKFIGEELNKAINSGLTYSPCVKIKFLVWAEVDHFASFWAYNPPFSYFFFSLGQFWNKAEVQHIFLFNILKRNVLVFPGRKQVFIWKHWNSSTFPPFLSVLYVELWQIAFGFHPKIHFASNSPLS